MEDFVLFGEEFGLSNLADLATGGFKFEEITECILKLGAGNLKPASYTTAAGDQANTLADEAVALGFASNASANSSIALGTNAASGIAALALGYESNVNSANAIAIGRQSKATAENAASFGSFAQASGNGSMALGANASAESNTSIAIDLNQKSVVLLQLQLAPIHRLPAPIHLYLAPLPSPMVIVLEPWATWLTRRVKAPWLLAFKPALLVITPWL